MPTPSNWTRGYMYTQCTPPPICDLPLHSAIIHRLQIRSMCLKLNKSRPNNHFRRAPLCTIWILSSKATPDNYDRN